jgi:hypothetical protein
MRNYSQKSGNQKVSTTNFTEIICGTKNCYTFASPEPAKPLNNAQMRGSFYFHLNSNYEHFDKFSDRYFYLSI